MNLDRIIQARDQVQLALNALSQALEQELGGQAGGQQSGTPPRAPLSQPVVGKDKGQPQQQQPSQVYDIWAIKWMVKGREPAPINATWGWAFAYTQDGQYIPEIKDLVQYLEQYGSLETQGYTVTLGGRDKSLLQLKKNKEA